MTARYAFLSLPIAGMRPRGFFNNGAGQTSARKVAENCVKNAGTSRHARNGRGLEGTATAEELTCVHFFCPPVGAAIDDLFLGVIGLVALVGMFVALERLLKAAQAENRGYGDTSSSSAYRGL
jgi:hypothetical protein